MRVAHFCLSLLVIAALVWPTFKARADGPGCSFNEDGSITCAVGGSGDDNGGEGGSGGESNPVPFACTPGATMRAMYYTPNGDGTCSKIMALMDQCTGSILDFLADDFESSATCPSAPAPTSRNPCKLFKINQGGISCGMGSGWTVHATVRFPETFLDVRPYPASLVRWPTALRNGGQPSASGSGTEGYYGRGSPGNPSVGDLSDITLTLTLNPAGPLFVRLPQVGGLALSEGGSSGTPQIIQWEVPSHPEAGGGPLAATVSGLDELPGDMPLFVGSGRSPYRLFWNLSYLEYVAIYGCIDGPDRRGHYSCNDDTGHRGIVGYEWRSRSSGGEIPPSVVANLPASMGADLDGDGRPEAYWDRNLTLRRMDEAGSVDNPTYRRSWNWGGLIYWAVREGQGQIGWPGNP